MSFPPSSPYLPLLLAKPQRECGIFFSLPFPPFSLLPSPSFNFFHKANTWHRSLHMGKDGEGHKEELCMSPRSTWAFSSSFLGIRDLHVAQRVEDIGFYAGFVGSSFMLGRALTSVFWGMIADRYGRKPVIVIGLITLVIFNTLFGLSTRYWMAIGTRFLLGFLNGLLGPIKAYCVEVARPEYQAVGVSLPADKFPNLFSRDSFYGRFPYFLPCLFISFFAAVVLASCYWLPETLHMHHYKRTTTVTTEGLEGSFHGTELKIDLEDLEASDTPSENLWTNWPLMSSIIVYCVFSLHDMAYTEIFPLWAESSKQYKGLEFSSQDVGEVLAISGFSLLAFQFFIYPPLEKILGHVNISRVAAMLAIPLTASYPFMANLSGFELSIMVNCASIVKNILSVAIVTGLFILQNNAVIFPLWAESSKQYKGLEFSSQDVGEVLAISGFSLLAFQFFIYPPLEKILGHVNISRVAAMLAIPLTASYPFMANLSGFELSIMVNCASIVKNILSVAIVTGLFILQNNAVSQHQRGAANGISMTGQSIFKAIAPAAGGAMRSRCSQEFKASGKDYAPEVVNNAETFHEIMYYKFLKSPEIYNLGNS
ncbi:putative peptide/nitrate transporter [Apostasia shenzhenica]|uniref:Putative peptide/nitrate transporter n=1 Tax=Apostasia shenzhenica TaxID=1088818 RepID=A0A2H9ZZH4_9ASPA|nr:putative peptide/nitrate transporter [Apostasia shenzhenica]